MLLEVRFKNYHKMVNETRISMVAEALSEHRYSLLTLPSKASTRVVPIKLFYGSAAVDKQKIVLGLKLMQMLIGEQVKVSSTSIYKLACNPNEPIQFGITVSVDQNIYDFDFAFTDSGYVWEEFKLNSTSMYKREKDSVKINKTAKTLTYYDAVLKKHLTLTEKLYAAKGEYLNDRLFLTTLFSCFISPDVVKPFLNYMANQIMFFDDSKLEFSRRKQLLPQLSGNDLRVSSATQECTPLLKAMLEYCMKHGICLIIGDNNTNFDPLEIIPYFKGLHNINLNHSCQLLMFTYQYLFMNKALIRRDEVCFIQQTQETIQFTNLSQYAAREENYIKKYLLGEYVNTHNYRATLHAVASPLSGLS